jgi:hypothetical protein
VKSCSGDRTGSGRSNKTSIIVNTAAVVPILICERDKDSCRKRSRSQQETQAVAQVLNQRVQMTRDRNASVHSAMQSRP